MGKTWKLVFILALMPPFSSAAAAQIDGVFFQDTFDLGGEVCSLVGLGTRGILFFNIYAAGLYMQSPALDADQVIKADEPKAMVIHFLYHRASVESLRENWRRAFDRAVPAPSPPLGDLINQFISLFDREALKGDQIALLYEPEIGVRIITGKEEKGIIPGYDFMEALFSVWFGPEPSDISLKKDVLGGRGCIQETGFDSHDALAAPVNTSPDNPPFL